MFNASRMRACKLFLALFAAALLVHAHVGSPDIYVDGKAGPYQLFVTIRTPTAIPGVAELEVRAESAGISKLTAVPMRCTS